MSRRLFELCGTDPRNRFSPYVWRVRLALCRKGLKFEGVPGQFLDKDGFAESGSTLVPVLKDGPRWVADSWQIACYLEDTYPARPSLFGGAPGKDFARFTAAYVETLLQPRMFMLIAPDIAEACGGRHREYFLETRARRIAMPVPDLIPLRARNLELYRQTLPPLRRALSGQPFLAGDAPLYPDFIVYGAFRWAAMVSALPVREGEQEISAWYDRVEAFYRDKITALEDEPLL